MLLEELEIRLRPIVWGEELVLSGRMESWCLNIYEEVPSLAMGAVRETLTLSVPLHTLSCVLTCEPSSIVCKVKSISGTGFFSCTARMVLSSCLVLFAPWPRESASIFDTKMRDNVRATCTIGDEERKLLN